MDENKKLYKTLTDKNNGLSAAQEVHYATDFKVAKKSTEQENTNNQKSNNQEK